MMTMTDQLLVDHFGDEYGGYPLLINRLGDKQWLIVLQATPACRLCLSAESEFTKKLDSLGLSNETKIGDQVLDETYVIRAENEAAQTLLKHPKVQEALRQMSPFVELELTHKEYRLILDGLAPTPEAMERTLNTLLGLVQLSQQAEGSTN